MVCLDLLFDQPIICAVALIHWFGQLDAVIATAESIGVDSLGLDKSS